MASTVYRNYLVAKDLWPQVLAKTRGEAHQKQETRGGQNQDTSVAENKRTLKTHNSRNKKLVEIA